MKTKKLSASFSQESQEEKNLITEIYYKEHPLVSLVKKNNSFNLFVRNSKKNIQRNSFFTQSNSCKEQKKTDDTITANYENERLDTNYSKKKKKKVKFKEPFNYIINVQSFKRYNSIYNPFQPDKPSFFQRLCKKKCSII